MRKIIRETTERGMPTSWTCSSLKPKDWYMREPKVVSPLERVSGKRFWCEEDRGRTYPLGTEDKKALTMEK